MTTTDQYQRGDPPIASAVLSDAQPLWLRSLVPGDAEALLRLYLLVQQDMELVGRVSLLRCLSARIARPPDPLHETVGAYRHGVLVGAAYRESLGAAPEVGVVVDRSLPAQDVRALLLDQLLSRAGAEGVGPGRATHGPRCLLAPSTTLVIGAGDHRASLGRMVLRNLASSRWAGSLWAMHPRQSRLDGVACVASIHELSGPPDLVVITLPADAVVACVDECGRGGAGAVVVLTAGVGDLALLDDVQHRAHAYGMWLLGPCPVY